MFGAILIRGGEGSIISGRCLLGLLIEISIIASRLIPIMWRSFVGYLLSCHKMKIPDLSKVSPLFVTYLMSFVLKVVSLEFASF